MLYPAVRIAAIRSCIGLLPCSYINVSTCDAQHQSKYLSPPNLALKPTTQHRQQQTGHRCGAMDFLPATSAMRYCKNQAVWANVCKSFARTDQHASFGMQRDWQHVS
jgi:hypothetical protein